MTDERLESDRERFAGIRIDSDVSGINIVATYSY